MLPNFAQITSPNNMKKIPITIPAEIINDPTSKGKKAGAINP